MTAPTMLEHALDYAGRGWPVFPLWWPVDVNVCACPDGASCGTDGKNAGKHPLTTHGLHDASTDPAQVAAWWQRWPEANIGMRTGVVFDVLDVDLEDFAAGVAELPVCDTAGGPVVRTGSGWHLWFLPTGSGNRAKFAGRCDWRGHGGYVIAPPSLHRSGRRYEWFAGPDLALTEAPEALRAAVLAPKAPAIQRQAPTASQWLAGASSGGGGWSPSGLIATVATAAEGERNAKLYWAACSVRDDIAAGNVTDPAVIDAALEQIETAAIRAGLSPHEVRRTIQSGLAVAS